MTITDDDLILYRFRDGLAPDELERIERAIAADAELAARYRALTNDLDRLREIEAPLPASTMRRWRNALDAEARPVSRRLAPGLGFAAAAAVVIAGVGIAWLAYREQGSAPVQGALASARVERALQLHLFDLESQLARASDLSVDDRAVAMRRLAEQNRLQTAVAERAGAAREARVLRAFTVALEDMAAQPDANGKFKADLARLDFEMKVTQARLASSSPSTSALRAAAL